MTDHAEFLRLFLVHQADVRMFVGSLVRDRQDREDLFQEVVLVLWEKFGEYDPTRSFGAWARGIAANKILQRRGKLGRRPTPFPVETVTAILDAFNRRVRRAAPEEEALEECLKPLPQRSRTMLKLRYGESLSVPQIGERVGLSAAAAFKALSRLRSRLRDCIERRLGLAKEGNP